MVQFNSSVSDFERTHLNCNNGDDVNVQLTTYILIAIAHTMWGIFYLRTVIQQRKIFFCECNYYNLYGDEKSIEFRGQGKPGLPQMFLFCVFIIFIFF